LTQVLRLANVKRVIDYREVYEWNIGLYKLYMLLRASGALNGDFIEDPSM
jgi:hypothetical protein